METIRIAAVVLRSEDGRILSVRKRGTGSFMLVGGKLEAGETPLCAAVREVAEELRIRLDPSRLSHLGRFEAPAANEDGAGVDCDVYLAADPIGGLPEVFEEIEEARFFAVDSESAELAPLSREVVLPILRTSPDKLDTLA
ncbi:NUDIX hydrolase [Corynebacterium sp. A21]|uniref:NUDIX hydrolase n=1 Tax=Corynebacterium sp. A21 TaxID=3457318 RepID=UPI003FD0642F